MTYTVIDTQEGRALIEGATFDAAWAEIPDSQFALERYLIVPDAEAARHLSGEEIEFTIGTDRVARIDA